MRRIILASSFVICTLQLCAVSVSAAENDGVLHTFFGFELETDGRRVASLNTSENVVLGTPIKTNFKGRCQVSMVFQSSPTEGYLLVLTIREVEEGGEDALSLPVEHSYQLLLDEKLQFSIQTHSGLVLSGNLSLTTVNRFELAD